MSDLVSLTVQSRTIQRHINRTQIDMVRRGNEVSTGKKENLVEDLRGDIRNYMDISFSRKDLDHRNNRLQTSENRLAQIGNSLEMMQGQTETFDSLLSQVGIIDRSSVDLYINQADQALDQMVTSLNTRWGGRYLFSGDSVLDPAVNNFDALKSSVETLIHTHATNAGGTLSSITEIDALLAEIDTIFDNTHPTDTFDDLAYNGGSGTMSDIEISQNNYMKYDVKANDSEIKEMTKGLILLATADTLRDQLADSSSREVSAIEEHYLKETTGTISSSGRGIIEKRASIGFKQERITDTIEGAEAIIFQYEQRIGYFENADQYEAGIAFSELQRQLEASFYVSAQLGRQSLVSYL